MSNYYDEVYIIRNPIAGPFYNSHDADERCKEVNDFPGVYKVDAAKVVKQKGVGYDVFFVVKK